MAKQYIGLDAPFKAHDDMSDAQYYFVASTTVADTVDVCSAVTDLIVGVAQHGGTTGAGVSVRFLGHTKITLGDTVTAGDLLSTDSTGRAITITAGSSTTTYIAGKCTKGGAVNEVGEMILIPAGRAA